jgi:hypothetical protein
MLAADFIEFLAFSWNYFGTNAKTDLTLQKPRFLGVSKEKGSAARQARFSEWNSPLNQTRLRGAF